jgi:hypothetical protein
MKAKTQHTSKGTRKGMAAYKAAVQPRRKASKAYKQGWMLAYIATHK